MAWNYNCKGKYNEILKSAPIYQQIVQTCHVDQRFNFFEDDIFQSFLKNIRGFQVFKGQTFPFLWRIPLKLASFYFDLSCVTKEIHNVQFS